jgi:hypothetical protein
MPRTAASRPAPPTSGRLTRRSEAPGAVRGNTGMQLRTDSSNALGPWRLAATPFFLCGAVAGAVAENPQKNADPSGIGPSAPAVWAGRSGSQEEMGGAPPGPKNAPRRVTSRTFRQRIPERLGQQPRRRPRRSPIEPFPRRICPAGNVTVESLTGLSIPVAAGDDNFVRVPGLYRLDADAPTQCQGLNFQKAVTLSFNNG